MHVTSFSGFMNLNSHYFRYRFRKSCYVLPVFIGKESVYANPHTE